MIDVSKIKITRQRRRTMALHILPDGTIEVRAPNFFPKFMINDFIKRNADWIEKKMSTFKRSYSSKRKYIDGEKFLYLGKEYTFTIGNYLRIELRDDKLLFPRALVFRAKIELQNWYIKQAKEFITKQVEHYSKEMKTSYSNISFSETKSKWGSCTIDNRLQFNWKLIMSPLLVVRYVVIHELAHTMEKNHSYKFWNKVRLQNPSYKEQIKWLKTYGHSLVI